jgi:hypothetical protein
VCKGNIVLMFSSTSVSVKGWGGGGERIAGLGVSISASGAVLNCHRGTESFRIEARIIKCVQDN